MGTLLESQEEPLNILYCGDGGTGKTTHLCHMADLGRVLVVNAESGVKKRALDKCGVNTGNIEVWPPAGEQITFRGLEAEWLRVREALVEDPDAYVGVVWDSLTEIYKQLLDAVVAKAYEKSLNSNKPRPDEFFIGLEDYGVMTEQMRQLIRKMRDLPCHFGASALERRDTDNDGAVVYRPNVTPALQADLYLWFDIVCHTDVTIDDLGEEYKGLFRAAGKYRGKDRFKSTPKVLVDPTFDRVLSYVEDQLTVEDDTVMKEATQRQKERKDKETNA